MQRSADSFRNSTFGGSLGFVVRRTFRFIGPLGLCLFPLRLALGQSSQHALRFYGTGAQQVDRARIPIDDDVPGADASTPSDVGRSAFTIEFWLRANLSDNSSPSAGSQGSFADTRWKNGNMVFDRGVLGGSGREFGISLAGGHVRFGTGRGDGSLQDLNNSLEGDVVVLDGGWHHVACVRDAGSGVKRIYVDGILDIESPAEVSEVDLSYPDDGVSGAQSPWGAFIVLAANKDDLGPAFPAFHGTLDELRIWNDARTAAEIALNMDRVLVPSTPGLVAAYRFEEGMGTALADSSAAGSTAGVLIAGTSGNGEWVHYHDDPLNTAPVTSGSLPAGFEHHLVVDNLGQATVLAFDQQGRIFVGLRTGGILIVANGALLPAPLIELLVDDEQGERGLVGLALDPDFAVNGYLYAYYTTTEPRNRVGRFTVTGDTAALASEQLIWQNPDLAAQFHHGGAIHFGSDGCLYIATGDQFNSADAQDLTKQHGKLLRVHADGSIPVDNPFVNVPGAQPAIWARGLRNPFRFTIDAQTGAVWIADVGGNTGASWEEINLGVAGANYGWPDQEGQLCATGQCDAFELPRYCYRHDDPLYVLGDVQAAIIAGPVWRSSAFPLEYRGNLFIGDYSNRWIRRLVIGASGAIGSDFVFQLPPTAGALVDLAESPDGALYVLTLNALQAIRYTGTTNQPPIVTASASQVQGNTPLAVQFTGSSSFDPDPAHSSLTFLWEFGDHASSSAPDPLHTYTAPGVHYAVLTVDDGAAQSSAPPITIVAGNAPVATIDSPRPGTTYKAGDTIAFAGSASDVEDGTLPASAFTWQVLLIHAGHVHPFYGPITNATAGSFTIPTHGHDPANTYYKIVLDVKDSDGLPGSATCSLVPVGAPVTFTTSPPGIPIFVDGEPRVTPCSFASLVGYQHELEAQPSYTLGGVFYRFKSWSNGSDELETHWTVPTGGGTVVAVYRKVWVRYPSQTH